MTEDELEGSRHVVYHFLSFDVARATHFGESASIMIQSPWADDDD